MYKILAGNIGKDYVKVTVMKEKKEKILKDLPVSLSNNLINSLFDSFGSANIKINKNET